MAEESLDFEHLLDRIDEISEVDKQVTLARVVQALGSRSFGSLLLVVGLILFSPLSAVPGTATTMAVVLALIAVQMLLGRHGVWLPRWLLARSVSSASSGKAVERLRPAARFIDRFLKRRLTFLVHGSGIFLVAVVCLCLALLMPLMELVPFSASTAGLVILIFGLSLLACDGLMALSAFVLTGIVLGFIVSAMI
ncbi:MAG: exopolysaccharide biosynthesis protein [Wenzhouxiangellaceae bacterium]|nr:exopolysaccharide biosynthesis protein [Wenzhouxiangellaceae bacterium]